MNNFTFANPVKIIFGKNTIKNIKNEISNDKKVLIVYGGGSIKKNGVYDQVVSALQGYDLTEFGGIEPNPHYETCMKAVQLIKENDINYVLAVGGGSVIDAVKFIVSATCFKEGDPWKILSDKQSIQVKEALPFGTVLTLSATASEMNLGAVITKAETHEKLSFGSPVLFPKFSVLDPTTTFTLPKQQISNGVVDSFVHVIEQYLTYPVNAVLQDFMAEAILKTLVLEGPKALENPEDYDVRANLMWASSWALNGWIGCGVPQDWATHMIGHEITAFYGIDHAQTLAIVLPGVMRTLKEEKKEKMLRLGREVFSIQENTTDELVESTIEAVENFFHKMEIRTKLSDYNLGQEAVDKITRRMEERNWKLGENRKITSEVVNQILEQRI